jgi:hypothetical protein
MFIDAAGSLSSTGLAATEDEKHRAYLVMRAVKGAIGFVYLAVNPVPGLSGADPVRAMPAETHSDKLNQLIAAENLLADADARSQQRFSWGYHIGNLLFNAAGAGAVVRDRRSLARAPGVCCSIPRPVSCRCGPSHGSRPHSGKSTNVRWRPNTAPHTCRRCSGSSWGFPGGIGVQARF